MYPEITKFMPFYLDEKAYLASNKCFILCGSHLEFLTAFLSSSLFRFAYRNHFPELLGGSHELRKIFFEEIRIPIITDTLNNSFTTKVWGILQNYEDNMLDEIDNMIFNLYNLTSEERRVIRENVD